jgi:D-lyxose ketol-isomerase
LKRSEINLFLDQAIDFFEAHEFSLPPFACWTPDTWRKKGAEADEIRNCCLGWDITDFHSGDFLSCGLALFTLRNGRLGDGAPAYAEKIMMVRENQVTPLHRHYRKTEDIINRGTVFMGELAVQLYNSEEDGALATTPVAVRCDGMLRRTEPGGVITLKAGESITLPSGVYHTFHAIHGTALIGEVSSQNDDAHDNHFYLGLPRFPEIIEDDPPLRLLCTEYP